MTIDVDAVYEDGVLKPERPLALKEGAKVLVTIEANAEEAMATRDATGSTDGKAIDALRGIVKARLQTWRRTTTSTSSAAVTSDLPRARGEHQWGRQGRTSSGSYRVRISGLRPRPSNRTSRNPTECPDSL
jgi:predicted DNA-binding antitoxin AbrB/MazE fold protein